MSTSGQTYKELVIPYFRETFECIDEVMRELEIPYYLIGASAIDLQLLRKGIRPKRATKDIDFAVMVSNLSEFERMRDALVAKGFRKDPEPWRFFSDAFMIRIDVLPFGGIEDDHMVSFSDRYTDLHVLGFQQVLESAEPILVEESIANVPTLAGMVILKLIAWSDRPEKRTDDLPDILRIIDHTFDLNDIAENHFDLLDADPFDETMIAAEVLGRECRTYLARSTAITERVMKLMSDNLNDASTSSIAKIWARKGDTEIEYSFELLKSFQKGLIHPAHPAAGR